MRKMFCVLMMLVGCVATPKVGDSAACSDDVDGDGLISMSCGGDDCDDENATSEWRVWYSDADGDGFGNPIEIVRFCWTEVEETPSGAVEDATDCDDSDPAVNPAAIEVCDGGIDNNCDTSDDLTVLGVFYVDSDADGYGGEEVELCEESAPDGYSSEDGDCDDANASVNPGATEICDGFDNDCTGDADDGIEWRSAYPDADGDGYGEITTPIETCLVESDGYVSDATDCNDSDATVNPAAAEFCDGVDQNCDGMVDNNATNASSWYHDVDNDGFGDSAVSTTSCEQPGGYVFDATDCDDSAPAINPAAAEVCDGADNNCDGIVDTDATDATVAYVDNDGDAWGDASSPTTMCAETAGYSLVAGDCDDADASANLDDADADGISSCDGDCDDADGSVSPSAPESCNDVDDDCDGSTDESGAIGETMWYADLDNDDHGDMANTVQACDQPEGYLSWNNDCNDADGTIYPTADEFCDGVDNNCDGAVDEEAAVDATTWYIDADNDGSGSPDMAVASCDGPVGYSADSSDCNDANDQINGLFSEVVGDGLDNDCDGAVDEDASDDVDGDGYIGDDCDDGDAAINPGASETCNEVDDDCNGMIDEGVATTWYRDADGDGFGDSFMVLEACEEPIRYTVDNTDCDDTNSGISPASAEVADDGVDQDCDGQDAVSEPDTGSTADTGDTGGDSGSVAADTGDTAEPTDTGDSGEDTGPVDTGDSEPVDTDSGPIDTGDSSDTGTAPVDADGDGYTADVDCDDDRSNIYPGATEACDGMDGDCDGTVDEEEYGDGVDNDCDGVAEIWYIDGTEICIATAAVFYGCWNDDGVYLIGDSPLDWTEVSEYTDQADDLWCIDVSSYLTASGTYELQIVSEWDIADSTCATAVDTTDNETWYPGNDGIDYYCSTYGSADPEGLCHSSTIIQALDFGTYSMKFAWDGVSTVTGAGTP